MSDNTQGHTPGPWTCHSGMVWKDGPEVYPRGKEDGIPIARMDREPGNGTVPVERDANARLIAAAPDLLAALEAFLRAPSTGSQGPGSLTIEVQEFNLKAARATIRKARGGPVCGLCARIGTNDTGGPKEHSPDCKARGQE